MMKKRKGTRGAISVFLAIILVPCIVVSSIFVDLSRVHLSKASAESSADLALNALLTNYDADLKDWYGMVASCQDISEFYDISAKYFLRALASQGMSDDEIVLLSDYYAHATNDDTIYDLLQVECTADGAPKITAVKDANLSNAALMKDQVVEFMKYRAPIEIATGFVDRLSKDTTVTEAFEASDNEPLVKDKQEFYESEGELTDAAFYTYLAIRDYYEEANKAGLNNEAISTCYGTFGSYKEAYKEILKYTISNLSNTNGLQRYNRYTISKTWYNDYYSNPSKKFSEVYSERKKVDGQYTYYIKLKDVEDLVEDLEEKIAAFNTAKSNFESAAQPVLNKLPYGDGDNQINPIQWWVLMNNAVNSSSGTNYTSKVKTAAEAMMKAYSKVLAIDSCELKGDLPTGWTSLEDWKTKYNATSLISTVESLHSKYLKSGVTNNNDTYLKAVKNLESVSSANYGRINAANIYITVDGQSMNLTSALQHISTMLNAERKEMSDIVKLLDKAIDGDGKDTPSLDTLKTYATTYEQKLSDWTTTANKTGTTMADQDVEEINKMKAESDGGIKAEDVAALKKRLVNIRSQFKDAITAIDSLKWGGTSIIEIRSIDTFKSKAGISTTNIGTTNAEIKDYTNTLFGQKFAPKTLPAMAHANDSAYNPEINPKTKEVATPKLWIYLYDKYFGVEKKVEEAKSEKEEAKKASDDKKKAALENTKRYTGGGKNVEHEYSGAAILDLPEVVSGVVGVVEDLVTLDFTGMRDDLYATTYVMEMFSHATYENEGKYNLLKESNPDKVTQLTLKDYPDAYAEVMGTSADDKDTWLSSDPEDHYNKSLTNHLINKENNAAYCAEIEYILCGSEGKTNEDNVKAVYSNIYTIRYGLNLVSGFQHFWNPVGIKTDPTAMALFSAASGVQAATVGVVPIAVTEAVLIPILTVFETAKDLDRLQAGFPVEMYKTEPGQWWVSLTPQSTNDEGELNQPGGISAFVSLISGEGLARHNTDNGLFYSDYLMLFVYLGFNSEAQGAMYQRMAEVIQFNIGTMAKKAGTMAKDSKYSLKKSQIYFTLTAKLRVKPLMITLPYFSMDDYRNDMKNQTDWCTYDINTVRGYN